MKRTQLTINELMRRCDDNINLAAWACDVSERQMRNYLNDKNLPIQRAALAQVRLEQFEQRGAESED